jgi:hypothetical protein
VIAALALLTTLQVGLLARWYRGMQPDIRELLAAAAPIAPDSRVLPLLFSRDTTSPRVGVLGHALGYAAAEKGLLDWGNYEGMTHHHPLRFRPETGLSDIYTLEAHPGNVNLNAYRGRTDYVFTWKMEPGSPIARRLRRHYKLVTEEGPGRVYRRKGRSVRK